MTEKPNPLPKINGRQVLAVAPSDDGRWWVVAEWNHGGAVFAVTGTLDDQEWDSGTYYTSVPEAMFLLATRLMDAYR